MDGWSDWVTFKVIDQLTDRFVCCLLFSNHPQISDRRRSERVFQPISRRILWLISFHWQFSNSSLVSMMPEDLCTKGEPEGQKLQAPGFLFSFLNFITWKSHIGFFRFYPFLSFSPIRVAFHEKWQVYLDWLCFAEAKLCQGCPVPDSQKTQLMLSTHFWWIFVWILPYCSYRFFDFLIIFLFFGNLCVMSSHPNWWIRLRNEVLEAKPERLMILGQWEKNLAE